MKLMFSTIFLIYISENYAKVPLVINTWGFSNASVKAWESLKLGKSAIDAVVEGCTICERDQCDGTVGYGGSPDENGETTLDAMIMDGMTMNVGAVAALRNIKDAIKVARHVLENTRHSLLVGDQATEFALQIGFKLENLTTDHSHKLWIDWKQNNCQPNFWSNVIPNPIWSCGPYQPESLNSVDQYYLENNEFGRYNHDTIGMIVIDKEGNVVVGTSTNGARNKIPGRVGDSPIIGSGAYADGAVGAAAATGDGDILMRFLPSFLAVENLRNGYEPYVAAKKALERIAKYYPNFVGAVIVATLDGQYSAACFGIEEFPYSVFNDEKVIVKTVKCFK